MDKPCSSNLATIFQMFNQPTEPFLQEKLLRNSRKHTLTSCVRKLFPMDQITAFLAQRPLESWHHAGSLPLPLRPSLTTKHGVTTHHYMAKPLIGTAILQFKHRSKPHQKHTAQNTHTHTHTCARDIPTPLWGHASNKDSFVFRIPARIPNMVLMI